MKRIAGFSKMAWRATLVTAVVGALVPLNAAPAQDAPASHESETIRLHIPRSEAARARPRAKFRAETEGSPEATIVGRWSDSATTSNEAQLSFGGGHALGERTTFMGTWVSPPSTSSTSPKMSIDYELGYSNAIGERVPITHAARARFAGGKWGPWVVARTPIAPSRTSVASGSVGVVVDINKPRRVQFQWKITGAISAPAALQGDFRLLVS